MGKPARDAVYASGVTDTAERLILFILADHSPSSRSPFEAWPGLARIAYCAGKSERQTQRYLAQLKKRGVIESYQVNRYQWGYRLLLADMTTDVTPQESDMTHDVTPDILDMTSVDTPAYPYGVSTDVTPDTQNGYRGVTSEHRGVTSEHRGVTSDTLLIRNEREEREEREERHTRVRTRATPSPASVLSADQAYRTLLQWCDGEVSRHELDSWARRVRPGWSGQDVLCLRGPASLVRLPRFTGCMRMAAKELDMGAVIEFSAIGA